MNWDAIGAIAEMLGSIAVIATLVLLLNQLKTNSAMINNSTQQSRATATSEWLRQLAGNPELYSIYRAGLGDDSILSKDDRGRFDLVLLQVFIDVSSVYMQYLNGGLDEESWRSELQQLRGIYETPGGKACWERLKLRLDERFRHTIEAVFDK
jgi:hypothetical protein